MVLVVIITEVFKISTFFQTTAWSIPVEIVVGPDMGLSYVTDNRSAVSWRLFLKFYTLAFMLHKTYSFQAQIYDIRQRLLKFYHTIFSVVLTISADKTGRFCSCYWYSNALRGAGNFVAKNRRSLSHLGFSRRKLAYSFVIFLCYGKLLHWIAL